MGTLLTSVNMSPDQQFSSTIEQQYQKSSLPLTELCALSSGTLHLSRNQQPPDLAGPVFDPAKEKKRKMSAGVTGRRERPTFKHERIKYLKTDAKVYIFNPSHNSI